MAAKLGNVQRLLMAFVDNARAAQAGCLALGMLFASAPLLAETAPATGNGVHLSWVRTESASQCPDANRIEGNISQRLGRAVFAGPPRISMEVAVSRSDGVWKATIEKRASDGSSIGSRTVTSDAQSCASLAAAASLAIALMIDPHAPPALPVIAQPAPSPARSSTSGAAEANAVSPLVVAANPAKTALKADPSSSGPRGAVAVAATVASDVLPGTSFGVGIAADVGITAHLYASFGGNFFPEKRLLVSGADVAFSMTWGTLGPCYRVISTGGLDVSGCASILAGVMHSAVLTEVPWQTGQRVWWGTTVGPRLAWSPGRWFELRAGVEALLPLGRRSYAIERLSPEPPTIVFTEPAVSVLASLGLGFRY